MVAFFDEINFKESQFRGRDTIRLEQLKYQVDNNFLSPDFRYKE